MISLNHQSQTRTTFRTLFHHSAVTAAVLITIVTGISVKAAPTPDPLIPRQVVFADEDKLSVRLSPDGQTISYLAPDEVSFVAFTSDLAFQGSPPQPLVMPRRLRSTARSRNRLARWSCAG